MCLQHDILDHKLEMVGRLYKAHRHPEPLKLTPVSNKGRVV